MPSPNQNPYFSRPVSKVEVTEVASFIEKNAEGKFSYSLQSIVQHCSTIFICQNIDNEWLGIVFTYQSPALYSTAAIEGMVVNTLHRRKGIATYLLDEAINYWKKNCIFHISIISNNISNETEKILLSKGFRALTYNGYTEFKKRIMPEKICVHNRQMRPSMNTINGEVGEETLFEYFQCGDIIWGNYAGGQVIRGVLLGKMDGNSDISFHYMQHAVNGEVHTGTSHSTTEFLNDGRIILYEDWVWTGNKSGGGRSVIEEIKPQD
jgi:hypothetical protein